MHISLSDIRFLIKHSHSKAWKDDVFLPADAFYSLEGKQGLSLLAPAFAYALAVFICFPCRTTAIVLNVF